MPPVTSPELRSIAPARADPEPSASSGATRSLKHRIADEAKRYLAFATYLAVVFGTLILFSINIYSRIDQDIQHYPSYHFYALGLINALVLAKLMLVVEATKLGSLSLARRLGRRPRAVLIVYRSLLFTAVLVAVYGLEEVLVGAWHGKRPGAVLSEMAGGPRGVITFAWVMFVALLPYFTYREVGRVVGPARLRALLFREPAARRPGSRDP
jgi:hypothetical protein